MGVVVDMGLPQVLCLSVDVRLVIVFHGRMIVLVRMSGRHVFPLSAVPQVVHDVSVLVSVNDGIMGVWFGPNPMSRPAVPCAGTQRGRWAGMGLSRGGGSVRQLCARQQTTAAGVRPTAGRICPPSP